MMNSTFRVALLALLLLLQSTLVIGFTLSSVCHSQSRSSVLQSSISSTEEKNELATELINTCKKYGQIGSKLSADEQQIIDDLAAKLEAFTDSSPAQVLLQGRHDLIYSSNKGASSGQLGPFVGKVSQSFLDDRRLINRVEIGPIKIELNAERKVLDGNRIRVKFKETAFYVFGNEVKRSEVKGAGVWDYLFSGSVVVNGENMFLRVLKTPSTFIIAQTE